MRETVAGKPIKCKIIRKSYYMTHDLILQQIHMVLTVVQILCDNVKHFCQPNTDLTLEIQ